MTTHRTSRWLIALSLLLALLALVLLWPTVALAAPGVQEEPAPGGQLSPELIVSVLAGGLAIALEVVPGLRKRWDSLSWELKRFLWLAGCLALGFAPPVLACLGRLLGLDLSALRFVTACDVDSVARGGQMAFTAFFASQTTQGLTKAGARAVNYLRNSV